MSLKQAIEKGEVARYLSNEGLDGWLLYDFKNVNPTMIGALELQGHMLTRRTFYFVPAQGEPVALVGAVESGSFPKLPGKVRPYAGRQALITALGEMLAGKKRIAMEYSAECAIPYLSRVDAGTLEQVRSFGCEVVSSGELVQFFLCRWDDFQQQSHRRASEAMTATKDAAFAFVAKEHAAGRYPLETQVQQVMLDVFRAHNIITDHPPIVAVGPHAGDPHHAPGEDRPTPVRPGDVLLLDLWGRLNETRAVYADITWMGYCGKLEQCPERVRTVWDIVAKARDAALELLHAETGKGRWPQGWEADRAARDVIEKAGYGKYFVHRTGHSIGSDADHGDGANLDDFETRDTRRLIPGLGFSIEPGIYLQDFGIRSEINVVMTEKGPRVDTPIQKQLVEVVAS